MVGFTLTSIQAGWHGFNERRVNLLDLKPTGRSSRDHRGSGHSYVEKQREHHAQRTTYERERVENERRKPVETGPLQDERASSYRP